MGDRVNVWKGYPPQLDEEALSYLAQTVKDWTIHNGLTVRPNPSFVPEEVNPEHVLATNAPVTLFPSPFPRKLFDRARALQKDYNALYSMIASDEEWLEEVMKELIEVDDFLANLWSIHLKVKEEGYVQDLTLGMFRSDYMLHMPAGEQGMSLKQVEFNTISSSFGGLAVKVAQMHKALASFPALGSSLAYPPHPLLNPSMSADAQSRVQSSGLPPDNHAISTLATALIDAHMAYGPSKSKDSSLPLCILFLVQEGERNLFDQMAVSSHIRLTNPNIPTFRLPVPKILASTSILPVSENSARPLIYTPPSNAHAQFEVSVVYFRALYAPTEYDTPVSWAARHHIERSAAIKCPSVLLHLAGSKKVQQVLADPSTKQLEHFLPAANAEQLQALRDSFAPQYSMSDGSESDGVQIAKDPQRAQNHVLKPQREGGGNNIYRENIPKFLSTIAEKEYKQYVLMELIQPPKDAENVALRSDGKVIRGNVISELGIFGTSLFRHSEDADKNAVVELVNNTEGGYLLRTKGSDSDEGGVAAGFSSLDSIVLYDTP